MGNKVMIVRKGLDILAVFPNEIGQKNDPAYMLTFDIFESKFGDITPEELATWELTASYDAELKQYSVSYDALRVYDRISYYYYNLEIINEYPQDSYLERLQQVDKEI